MLVRLTKHKQHFGLQQIGHFIKLDFKLCLHIYVWTSTNLVFFVIVHDDVLLDFKLTCMGRCMNGVLGWKDGVVKEVC